MGNFVFTDCKLMENSPAKKCFIKNGFNYFDEAKLEQVVIL